MRDGYQIIDSDRHVIEPMDMWKHYLEPAFHSYAPYYQHTENRDSLADRCARLGSAGLLPLPPEIMVADHPIVHQLSDRARIQMALVAHRRLAQTRKAQSPQGQLAAMDEEGIDIAFLYPTIASFVLGIDTIDTQAAAALTRAYNDWLRDFCSTDPHRLRGVGLISRHDPQDMVSELTRIAEFGWRAVVLRPNPVKGRTLSHPAYEPFWSECERRSIAVSIHEGTHTHLPTAGADRFDTRFALHACSHPLEQMMALLTLIEGGVLERHPGLRVAFFEAGCGWLPYWLWRLDEVEHTHFAWEVHENVRMKPSAYFRRQCFVAIEPEEPYIGPLIDFIGVDHILFGSDFPHFDHEFDVLEKTLGLAKTLSTASIGKIVADNPKRFYQLDS